MFNDGFWGNTSSTNWQLFFGTAYLIDANDGPDLNLNQTWITNGSLMFPPIYDDIFYTHINVTDPDSDLISYCNYTIKKPTGSAIVNNVNGTLDSTSDLWNSSSVSISCGSDCVGNWNVSFVCDDTSKASGRLTKSFIFPVTDTENPNATIVSISTGENPVADITLTDNVEVEHCFYNVTSGATCVGSSCNIKFICYVDFVFPDTGSLTIGNNYTLTIFINDSSGNSDLDTEDLTASAAAVAAAITGGGGGGGVIEIGYLGLGDNCTIPSINSTECGSGICSPHTLTCVNTLCQDGYCDYDFGETYTTCPSDCGLLGQLGHELSTGEALQKAWFFFSLIGIILVALFFLYLKPVEYVKKILKKEKTKKFFTSWGIKGKQKRRPYNR